MKRFVLLLFLATIFCSFLSATVVIEAEGIGKTLEEAKENARFNLAEKVFPGSFVGLTTTSTYDDTIDSSSIFTQKSSYSVMGEFSGYDYSVISSEAGNYVVLAKIEGDEGTIGFYLDKMEEQADSVKQLYNQYLSLDVSVSATKRKEKLQAVLICYDFYDMYASIMRRLGGTVSDEDILPKTKTVLCYELESLVTEEENELRRKSKSESINQEIIDKLKKNALEKEKTEKVIKDAKEQAKELQKVKLQQKLDAYTSLWKKNNIAVSDTLLGLDSFYEYLKVIQESNTDLIEMTDEYENLIKEQSANIEKAYKEEEAAIRNRAYPSAHLNLSGNPTSDAKKLREQEVAELRSQKDKEKQECIDIIDSSALTAEIQKRYDYYKEALALFRTEEFCLLSSKEEATLEFSRYDGENYCWYLTLLLYSNDSKYLIPGIKLEYSVLTGEQIPTNASERLKYIDSDNYIQRVEVFDEIFRDRQPNFFVSFNVNPVNSSLYISVNSLTLQFADGTEVSIKLDKKYSIEMQIEKIDFLSSYGWFKESNKKAVGASKQESSISTSSSKQNGSTTKTNNQENDTTGSSSIQSETQGNGKSKFTTAIFGDLQLALTLGELLSENMNGSIEIYGGGRFFINEFFVSCSANISWVYVTNSNSEDMDVLLQYGFFLGAGYRIKIVDYITCSIRFSCNTDLGFLINPCLSVPVTNSSETGEIFFGLYINCKTGKFAASFGVDCNWRFEK